MMRLNLTDARIKALRCGEGAALLEVRDIAVPGLEVRVMASGAKSWRLHYTRRSDGKRRAFGLGAYPALSLKAARTKAKRLQSDIEDAEVRADPAAKRQARTRAPTFSQLAEEWIERHGKPNKSPRAVRDDQSMLNLHILPALGSKKASELAKRDISHLLDDVAAKSDARTKTRSNTRKLTHRPNRVFELVRSIFRWALARDLIEIDPTSGLSRPIKKENPRERELATDEIRRLWQILDNAPLARPSKRQPGDFPMTYSTALTLKLALTTAQRIGEVAGIALSELSLTGTAPTWTIPGSRSKNGQPNRVPLSPIAVRLVLEARQLADGSPWLFPSPKGPGPIDPHAPTKALERARSAIGIENFRIHDLRRTAATQMAELGINPHTISQVLNHVSVTRGTVTGRAYVKYQYDREKRHALETWAGRLERILAGECGNDRSPFEATT